MKLILTGIFILTFSLSGFVHAEYDREQMLQGVFSRPLLTDKYGYDLTAYSNCILKNGKSASVRQVEEACRLKSTPKKCRDVVSHP